MTPGLFFAVLGTGVFAAGCAMRDGWPLVLAGFIAAICGAIGMGVG